MEIAVLSDIHGNYEAFRTCVEYLLNRNINTFCFLGDYVGELAFPQKTMDLLYELRDNYHCTFVKGNKEDYWINYRKSEEKNWKLYDSTTGSLAYSYRNLTEADLDFFESLNIQEEIAFPNKERFIVCHGSPINNRKLMQPDDEETYQVMDLYDTKLIVCGHTHIQGVIQYHGGKVLNPGAVGVALHSVGKAQCMILHDTENGWKGEFISLSYNVEKEIEELYRAKLDEFAPYWCKVTEQLLRHGIYSHGEVLKPAMQFCQKAEGNCIWPYIPEKYWKMAYEYIFEKDNR